MAKSGKLFTIGYEQTPAKAVLDELENAGVKLLVLSLIHISEPTRP